MIKGVIFDMDGVMIDTERQSTRGWQHVSEKYGMDMPMWLINKFKGAPAHITMEDLITGKQGRKGLIMCMR